jgi:hypothetical protein
VNRNKLEQPVGARVWREITDQVWRQVWSQVGRPIVSQVENQAGYEAWIRVRDQVLRPIEDAVVYEAADLVNRQSTWAVNLGSQSDQSSVGGHRSAVIGRRSAAGREL